MSNSKTHTLTIQERILQAKMLDIVQSNLNNNKPLYKLDKELFRQVIVKELPDLNLKDLSLKEIYQYNKIECRLHKAGSKYTNFTFIDYYDGDENSFFYDDVDMYKDNDEYKSLDNIIEMVKLDFFLKFIKEMEWDK